MLGSFTRCKRRGSDLKKIVLFFFQPLEELRVQVVLVLPDPVIPNAEVSKDNALAEKSRGRGQKLSSL